MRARKPEFGLPLRLRLDRDRPQQECRQVRGIALDLGFVTPGLARFVVVARRTGARGLTGSLGLVVTGGVLPGLRGARRFGSGGFRLGRLVPPGL